MKIKISIKIILLFVTAIAVSFLTDHLHTFLGDWFCIGKYWNPNQGLYGDYVGCQYGGSGNHTNTWHWGYRHWLVFLMGLCLAIVQIVDIINTTDKKN